MHEQNDKIIIPPIKCQGIKTKLIPFIKETISFDKNGIWIEPFLGSGVVAFNIKPTNAILADKNEHIINFYKNIQDGQITSTSVKNFLLHHGELLKKEGNEYYIKMREDFNKNADPMYFLFLNRADFNGMIRFNKKGEFNVPFCKKPNRFSKAYITKICNQIDNVSNTIKNKNWTFLHCDWKETFSYAGKNDFIYLDPPYIGRDTSYIGEWTEQDAVLLSEYSKASKANVCLSMWKGNQFRQNVHLYKYWADFLWNETSHFYHVGAKEKNRHPMIEVLAIKN